VSPSHPTLPAALEKRYLDLLGVDRRIPSVEALHELVQAHACRVPFENISKLYHLKHSDRRGVPDLETFVDGIERYHFGGTCYTNNHHLYLLMASLGYDAVLCGADMSNPDVHLVSMVTVEGRQFLVDVGYAAPFVAPLPRDLQTEHVVESGGDRYVLSPQDDAGRSRLDVYRDGERRHGYVAKPEPRRFEEFASAIRDSYREDATFLRGVLLARCSPDGFLVVRNLRVLESEGTRSEHSTLADVDTLVDFVAERFAIAPRFTRTALRGLGDLRKEWNP
jgi:arylamine N-acetyltransferase